MKVFRSIAAISCVRRSPASGPLPPTVTAGGVRHAGTGAEPPPRPRRSPRRPSGLFETLSDRAEERSLLRLGLQETRRGLLARTSPTTGRSPSRTSSATSTPRSRGRHPRHLEGHHQSRMVRPSSSSNSRTTPAARSGASEQSIAIFGTPGGEQVRVRADRPAHDATAPTAIQRNTSPSAARSSTATPPAASTRRPAIPTTSSGRRPCRPTKSIKMLDPKQQAKALVAKRPKEAAVGFKGEKGDIPRHPGRRNWRTSRRRSCKRC